MDVLCLKNTFLETIIESCNVNKVDLSQPMKAELI
ncbi:MAG: Unknown protein [uncultured Sulfurovum sp.]|uniref:Uncharacterized protein n=1 Tax=uncultured Sulfurovum sp. TaxID=269237 RepID=A0A6S6TTS9_9BACT|nr:MAG: Unknown protein [uncultured Sulfurovum sp.]